MEEKRRGELLERHPQLSSSREGGSESAIADPSSFRRKFAQVWTREPGSERYLYEKVTKDLFIFLISSSRLPSFSDPASPSKLAVLLRSHPPSPSPSPFFLLALSHPSRWNSSLINSLSFNKPSNLSLRFPPPSLVSRQRTKLSKLRSNSSPPPSLFSRPRTKNSRNETRRRRGRWRRCRRFFLEDTGFGKLGEERRKGEDDGAGRA